MQDKKPSLPETETTRKRNQSRFMETARRYRRMSRGGKKFQDLLVKLVVLLAVVAFYALCCALIIGFWYLVWNKLVCRAFPTLPHATYLQVIAVCFVLGFVGSYFRSQSKGD